MSDVVAAALIAGGVGLLGSVATLTVTRWNTIDQTRQRHEDQLIEARTGRQEQYARLAWQLGRLHKYDALGFAPTREDWADWLDQYDYICGVVQIVGSESVNDGVSAFTSALEEAAPDLRAVFDGTPDPVGERWHAAYQRYRTTLDRARADLLDRMRRDGTD